MTKPDGDETAQSEPNPERIGVGDPGLDGVLNGELIT